MRTTSTPSGMSTSTLRRLLVSAPRTSSAPEDSRTVSLSEARSSRWRPVVVLLLRSPLTVPSNTDLAAPGAGAGAEVDDVVGDRDRLRLVLDDQHRVALVAQLQQQLVHPLDVVRVQPDRRLVEDVGDVGQRGAELADHLDPLRLAAGERARGAVERRGSRARSRRTSRGCAAAPPAAARPTGSSRPRTHSARSLICIAQTSAMLLRLIFDERASSLSRVPSHSGQVVKVTARSTKARTCGCSESTSLARNDCWIFGIRPS